MLCGQLWQATTATTAITNAALKRINKTNPQETFYGFKPSIRIFLSVLTSTSTFTTTTYYLSITMPLSFSIRVYLFSSFQGSPFQLNSHLYIKILLKSIFCNAAHCHRTSNIFYPILFLVVAVAALVLPFSFSTWASFYVQYEKNILHYDRSFFFLKLV